MLFVKIRIGVELLAWDIGTLSAVNKALILTAYCYWTLSIEGMSVCFDTSSAPTVLFVAAARAVESAS